MKEGKITFDVKDLKSLIREGYLGRPCQKRKCYTRSQVLGAMKKKVVAGGMTEAQMKEAADRMNRNATYIAPSSGSAPSSSSFGSRGNTLQNELMGQELLKNELQLKQLKGQDRFGNRINPLVRAKNEMLETKLEMNIDRLSAELNPDVTPPIQGQVRPPGYLDDENDDFEPLTVNLNVNPNSSSMSRFTKAADMNSLMYLNDYGNDSVDDNVVDNIPGPSIDQVPYEMEDAMPFYSVDPLSRFDINDRQLPTGLQKQINQIDPTIRNNRLPRWMIIDELTKAGIPFDNNLRDKELYDLYMSDKALISPMRDIISKLEEANLNYDPNASLKELQSLYNDYLVSSDFEYRRRQFSPATRFKPRPTDSVPGRFTSFMSGLGGQLKEAVGLRSKPKVEEPVEEEIQLTPKQLKERAKAIKAEEKAIKAEDNARAKELKAEEKAIKAEEIAKAKELKALAKSKKKGVPERELEDYK